MWQFLNSFANRFYPERLEDIVEERTHSLQVTQERLIEHEKLAVLGQLAGSVAHEIRNPLGVISNAIYFLQMTSPDVDETTKEYRDLIARHVAETEKIVSALLDFSHTRPPVRETVAVGRLVADALAGNPPPEHAQVTTEIAPDLPPVFVDASQIGQQVLTNLITNAYQSIPDGGELTISAQVVNREAGKRHLVYKSKGESSPTACSLPPTSVVLTITDTGHGMSAKTMAKIFEPLFTTKAKGIGLGLAVSKNLAAVNGGSIEVESVEGQGSTFTLTLPATVN